jgi:chromatin structure-remodeling complex subunit RSC9
MCEWSSCGHVPITLSHVCTHLPLTNQIPVAEQVTIHPSSALSDDPFHNILSRPPPPLSRHYKLHFTASITPTDSRHHPIGVTYLTSLLLRNIARTLRSDLTSALPADAGLTQEAKAERKKHLQADRFGLPIPDNVLKEEEEEEKEAGSIGGEVAGINSMELERARLAFESMEPRILEVIEGNMSGLAQYLGECAGFGAFGGW